MKKILIGIFIVSFCFCMGYSFSVGISLGNPTGISLKLHSQKDLVYDLVMNFASNPEYQYFYIHCDFLKYDYNKIVSKDLTGKFPVFYGLGIKVENTDGGNVFGLRFVIGLEYIFADIPFEIFFKLAPYVDIAPTTGVGIAPSIGIRYIFR